MSPKLRCSYTAARLLVPHPYLRTSFHTLSLQTVKKVAYNRTNQAYISQFSSSSSSEFSSSASSYSASGQYGSNRGPEPVTTPADQQQRQDEAAQEAQGPNMDTLPHISEEAAAVGKAKGEGGPEIEEQGTPVQEVIKEDSKAASKLPKVLKETLKQPNGTNKNQRRSYSTETASNVVSGDIGGNNETLPDLSGLGLTSLEPAETTSMAYDESDANDPTLVELPQLKFDLPELPLPERMHLKRRNEPFIDQMTKLLMQSGKLSTAQRIMSMAQSHLRTLPPPRISPRRPLLPGAPPPSHLPLNPAVYMELAIDSVAPLMRIRNQRGVLGGGSSLLIPTPLHRRQRRRIAINWVIAAANRKPELGVGHAAGFARRLAEEIVAVVEGRSGTWDKRGELHRAGTQARINVGSTRKGKKKKNN